LIVRNEETFLGQCLDSVRALAAQIVVVDTGSRDRTLEIAQQHGAESYQVSWEDDFSAARNAALAHATGDWILMLDADEELPPEAQAPLRQMLATTSVMAWRLPLVDVGREDEGCCYVPRLFRNAPGLFYVGRIHEQIFPALEPWRRTWGLENRLGNASLRHHGYRPDVTSSRAKIERNLRLLKLAIAESPCDVNLQMNYGLELARSGQSDAGLTHYRAAFQTLASEQDPNAVPEFREMLLSQFCSLLMKARKFDEVFSVLNSPLAQRGGLNASLHFMLGLACLELKIFSEGASQMRACIAKRRTPALAPINPEIHRAGPRHCLALCLEQSGQVDAALEELRLATREAPQSRPARLDYARLLARQGKKLEALNLYYGLACEQPEDALPWTLGAEITLTCPEFLETALEWTAEAERHTPGNQQILRQRAEALTLAGQCAPALSYWRKLDAPAVPRLAAALIMCEKVTGESRFIPEPSCEVPISREFVAWYRRLLHFRAYATVERLNTELKSLARVLPTAADCVAQALAEAARPQGFRDELVAPQA
jgi:tetratricopeptide (TPR) repeat protein